MNDSEAAIGSAQQVISSSMENLEETGVIANSTAVAADQQHTNLEMIHHKGYKVPNSKVTLKHDQPAKTAEGFPFMKLPPEVRNMIYKEVLVPPKDIHIQVAWCSYARTAYDGLRTINHSPRRTCRLLRVSKAVYYEAFPIYFGCNTFYCDGVEALGEFLSKLKKDYRRNVRSLSFHFVGNSPAKSIKLLQGCVSLKSLEIGVTLRMLDDYGLRKPESLKWLPGLNDLMKVRGIQELKVNLPGALFHPYWESLRNQVSPESFIEDLQVLKHPRSEAMIRRQDKKDFPPEKAKRTVFGKANAKTRAEKAMADEHKEEE